VVISITLGVCGTAVLIAALYYRSLNRAADPRTLPVREMIQTEETGSLRLIFLSHNSQTALHSSRIVLEPDRKSSARDIPLPDVLVHCITFPET